MEVEMKSIKNNNHNDTTTTTNQNKTKKRTNKLTKHLKTGNEKVLELKLESQNQA